MAKSPPPPEGFAERARGSHRTLTFRLNEAEHAALLKLAKRANVGHATLVRKLVEHYITQHTPAKSK